MEGYAHYRPPGAVSLEEVVKLMGEGIVYAREQGVQRLLIDTTQTTGIAPPQTIERYQLARHFAEAAQSRVRVAVLTRPELIDPSRFGVTVAQNRGLMADVFANEAEALAWLLK